MAFTDQKPVTAGSNSAPLFFPARAHNRSVKIIPGAGGAGNVQFTLDDEASVRADPDDADWETWEPDEVSTSTSRAIAGAITAVRGVAVTEDAVIQVAADTDY